MSSKLFCFLKVLEVEILVRLQDWDLISIPGIYVLKIVIKKIIYVTHCTPFGYASVLLGFHIPWFIFVYILRPCILNFKLNIWVSFRVVTSFSQFPKFNFKVIFCQSLLWLLTRQTFKYFFQKCHLYCVLYWSIYCANS